MDSEIAATHAVLADVPTDGLRTMMKTDQQLNQATKMGFFETLILTTGIATTKTAASAMVKKSGAIYWEKKLQPLLQRRSAKKLVSDGAKKYLSRLDKSTKILSTVAMSGGSGMLSEIYVPLRIFDTAERKSHLLDSHPKEVLEKNRRIIITDTAGMGKSTTMKFIVQTALIDLEALPILIELRKVQSNQSLLDFITMEFCKSSNEDCRKLISELIENESILLLLDGYDEVDDSHRKQINLEISEISLRAADCTILVASRPDSELKGLPEFREFTLQPLLKEEAYQLIKNYDKGGETSSRLIDKLESNYQVSEFLGNPLMVSLLYKAFNYKNTIPFKRNIFFRQVYDALFQDHDLSKGGGFERVKKSSLDIEDFHRSLRALGIVTYFSSSVQYPQEKFHNHLKDAKRIVKDISLDPSKFRSDLLSAVPVFVKEGNEVRWAHKAFQDYFSASFIHLDARGNFLQTVMGKLVDEANPRRHENLLLILSDLDRSSVIKHVVAPILKELLQSMDSGPLKNHPHGFKLTQFIMCGEVALISNDFGKKIRGKATGFHNLLERVAGLRHFMKFSKAHIPETSDEGPIACFINNSFSDKLSLVNSLTSGHPANHRSKSNWLPKLREVQAEPALAIARKMQSEIKEDSIHLLSQLIEGDPSLFTDDVERSIESYLMVEFIAESTARALVNEANQANSDDLDWLLTPST